MFIAFLIEGVGIIALANLGTNPVAFVLLSGLVFFAWGEIYSLFPATVTDTFGSLFATTNTGLMYTAKGTAALLVPVASVWVAAKGNWHGVFVTAAVLNILAAIMAIAILKPMRNAYTNRTGSVPAAATSWRRTEVRSSRSSGQPPEERVLSAPQRSAATTGFDRCRPLITNGGRHARDGAQTCG